MTHSPTENSGSFTVTVPESWPESAYLRFARTVNEGCSAITHLAWVQPSQEEGRLRGYVKHYVSPKGLFNEWLGHTVARALGVAVPRCAVMPAPVPGTNRTAWAFVSVDASPDGSDKPSLKSILHDVTMHELQLALDAVWKWPGFAALAAVDQLLANGDRNTGNLVMDGNGGFVAIDFGEVLGSAHWTTSSAWDLASPQAWVWSRLLQWNPNAPLHNLPPATEQRIMAAAEVATERFFQAYPALFHALHGHDNPDSATALTVLWWRANDLVAHFTKRLQYLV